ncbi:rhodanese-like domain-containing protein [Legionella maceachernii]|uniref:Rhodanese domain-containing protein n=1 Tax=Legionella maceachernii TaxID=466 RepID=A0A0W0VWZ7_9GAMM|nr:rhodanese-like domain-containing protein [Legionella maceachernii]KTD24531.1 Rhodanese domain-containing protein [Legionella maceachernii]SJZ61804.1 Rhodanese-related sulfurtransferase [Legionella maceachernii]SUP00925.1 Probable adenylyltransferase/sulfurtransferase MoeZ [Legionella maceachernii]
MNDLKINTIDVHELKKRLDANPNLCLIDVRELHEWQTLRIPGALHIPKDELPFSIEAKIPDCDTPIYLHCKGGVRSLYAANCLLTKGYKEVYSVDGGIAEWAASGYPIEK